MNFIGVAAALLLALNISAADPSDNFKVGTLSFTKPEKWTRVEIQPGMRAAQLEVKGDAGAKGEVIFFHFSGGGGGVQANIDRWLGMFKEGKDQLKAKTEKVTHPKGTVTFVQAEGTYMSGMPGGPKTAQPGTMLQGAIVEGPGANVFIRFTGPIALVKDATADFRKMVETAVK